MTTQETPRKRLTSVTLDRLDIIVMVELLGLFLVGVLISGNAHLLSQDVNGWAWVDSAFQNVGTEMLGAALTFYLIEVIVRKRREQDAKLLAIEQEKERLILQMGSPDKAFAVEAARILKARGWGFEGDATLHGAHLRWANLQGVNLEGASLQEANLWEVNLDGAFLVRADLRGADLRAVNLQGALMMGVNLRGALLDEANLQGARLDDITVYGPGGPQTVETGFDGDTTLPDGSHWTPGTDMRRFTDPSHPDFWRSDQPGAHAYRGEEDG